MKNLYKIEIIVKTLAYEAQQEVNEFISTHNVERIDFACVERRDALNYIYSIIYTEKVENEVEDIIIPEKLPISSIKMSTRLYNALRMYGINTIDDILYYGLDKIRSIRTIGDKLFNELLTILDDLGVKY